MKIIVISSPTSINNEHEIVNNMLASGLEYFHLRKPGYNEGETVSFIEKINPAYRKNIVLHEHHCLALEWGLKGVHYNTRNPFGFTHAVNFKSIEQSISCHSIREVKEANSVFSYVFLSPIFDSISKAGYNAAFDRDELRLFLKNRPTNQPKVIALGGVDKNTIPHIEKMGFDGAAMMGSIWKDQKKIIFPSFTEDTQT